MKNINIYIILLVLIILQSSYTWAVCSWMRGTYAVIVGGLMLMSCKVLYKPQQNKQVLLIGKIAFFIIFLATFFAARFNIASILISFVANLSILTLFMINNNELQRISQILNKVFATFISISLGMFLLNLIGFGLPNLGKEIYNQYSFINYFYIYLDSINYGINSFVGFTLEPGYFSLLLVCLLLLNEYNFNKKSTWLYVICLLFSLSLGGYLLGFVSFVLHNLLKAGNWKRRIIYIICIIGILSLIVTGVLNYNGGNNIIAEEILNRLAYDDELGIVGNNRENIIAKEIFDDVFYSPDIWMGIGVDRFKEATNIDGFDACSWRVFVIVYGAIYTVVFFFLSICYFSKTNIKKTIPFFVVYWLDFLQHGTLFSESLYFLIIYMNMNILPLKKNKKISWD